MIRIKLMDGTTTEIPQQEVQEVIPLQPLFINSCLKDPISALIYLRGKVIPVLGPLGHLKELRSGSTLQNSSWLLLHSDFAQVIDGLPEFMEDQFIQAPNQKPSNVSEINFNSNVDSQSQNTSESSDNYLKSA